MRSLICLFCHSWFSFFLLFACGVFVLGQEEGLCLWLSQRYRQSPQGWLLHSDSAAHLAIFPLPQSHRWPVIVGATYPLSSNFQTNSDTVSPCTRILSERRTGAPADEGAAVKVDKPHSLLDISFFFFCDAAGCVTGRKQTRTQDLPV